MDSRASSPRASIAQAPGAPGDADPSVDKLADAVTALKSWAHAGGLSEPLVLRVLAHPRFDRAARTLAVNMQAAAREDRRLDGIFKDAGRYVGAMLSLFLHLTGGLTLPRLKAFCAESGFVSPGRARAMLLYLRYLGYVEPLPASVRPQRYVPTARFSAAWRVQTRAALGAVSTLEPGAGAVLAALDRPEVFDGYCRSHLQSLFLSASQADQASALAREFMHRHAGSQLMSMILLSGDAHFPPRTAGPISVTAAAKRYSVSRIQIQRILDGATRAGLVTRSFEGVTLFTEAGAVEVRRFYARQLSLLLGAAAAAVDLLAA
jgi:hypothetical protein